MISSSKNMNEILSVKQFKSSDINPEWKPGAQPVKVEKHVADYEIHS